MMISLHFSGDEGYRLRHALTFSKAYFHKNGHSIFWGVWNVLSPDNHLVTDNFIYFRTVYFVPEDDKTHTTPTTEIRTLPTPFTYDVYLAHCYFLF